MWGFRFSARSTSGNYDIATERMRITSTRNVGIGKMPAVTFKVSGNIKATKALQKAGTNLTSKYLQLSGGNITGNLGVGAASPEVKLDVNGSLLIRAFGTSNGGTSGIFLAMDFQQVIIIIVVF